MFKRAVVLLLLFLFIFPVSIIAHTALKESNPKDGETITEELKEITLTYNTDIGPTSFFELRNENEGNVPVDIQVNGKVLKGTVAALPNGQYVLNWKIAGADGHIIEGNIAFVVQVETQDEPEQSPSDNEAEQNEPESSEVAEPEPPQVDRQNSSLLLWVAVIVGSVGALSFLLWRRQR